MYTTDVLALADSHGFGITADAVPLGLLALVADGLALLLPSWRRRSPAGISGAKTARLDDATRAGSTPTSAATTDCARSSHRGEAPATTARRPKRSCGISVRPRQS